MKRTIAETQEYKRAYQLALVHRRRLNQRFIGDVSTLAQRQDIEVKWHKVEMTARRMRQQERDAAR